MAKPLRRVVKGTDTIFGNGTMLQINELPVLVPNPHDQHLLKVSVSRLWRVA
jgi:hypothetical protein